MIILFAPLNCVHIFRHALLNCVHMFRDAPLKRIYLININNFVKFKFY